MKRRMPLLVTFLAVVLLSASLAYWVLQLNQPAQRAIAAPPPPPPVVLNLDAAKGLFGGQITVAAASNYQLKGVVAAGRSGSGRDSAAILSVDNQAAQAYGVGREVAPGVTVKEIHPRFVLLSEGGVIQRVELPSDAGVSSSAALSAPAPVMPVQQPQQPQPQQQLQQPQPQVQMQPAPAMQPQPAAGQANPRPANNPNAIGPVPGFGR